ncbi:MAG: DUF2817 domain-containing protein [Armatimonadota bacterium]|nr:DUF2817 domain-containing protein [Armatimonadota bacterium]
MKAFSRYLSTAVVISLLIAVPLFGAPAHSVSDRASEIASRLRGLPAGGAFVVEIGRSVKGRPIHAVVVTRAQGPALTKCLRILVISGQHGNEEISVEAAVEFIDDLAHNRAGLTEKAPRNVALVFVPVVNPDGLAANRRCNASGVDLNRNWDNPDQPETIAVTRLVTRLRPDVVIDLHQWTDEDPNRPNCVEAAGFEGCPEAHLAQVIAAAVTPGTPLRFVPYGIDSNPRLAHRRFTRAGTCGLLVETAPGWPEKQRTDCYKTVIRSTVSLLRSGLPGIERALAASRGGEPAPSPWLAAVCAPPNPKPVVPKPGWIGICLASGGLVLAWAPKLGRGRRGVAQSDAEGVEKLRTFTMSELIQSDLPPRDKLAVMHRCRLRPTDRIRQ